MCLFKQKNPRKWEFGPNPKVNWIATNVSQYNMETICKLILTKILNIQDIQLNVYTSDKTVSKFDGDNIEILAILDGHPETKIYTLFLRSYVTGSTLLKIICHEMVHLKQYYEGNLRLKDTTFYWKGQSYKHIDYWSRPWEQEARNKQYDIEKQVKELYYE